MKIAFFDFDGTLTTKDSMVKFIQFAVGKPAYYMGLLKLSPMLVAYMLKLIPNDLAKEKLVRHFFKSWDEVFFQKIANQYSLDEIDKIIRPSGIKKLSWHQERGHEVVIVSASMESWLKPWCKQKGVELISTRLEVINTKLTGKFSTKNCYGPEKVNRIKENYDLSQYEQVYAYGDSRGDEDMLALADEPFYKRFN